MAHDYSDNDSTFGEDISLWLNDSMFDLQSTPLAGTKRHVDTARSQPTSPGPSAPWEYQAEHIDPRAFTQTSWASNLPSRESQADAPPSKRRASVARAGPHCLATNGQEKGTPLTDQQAQDICYELTCRGFTPCASPCAQSPCATPCEDECTGEDVCRDPHCDQVQPCLDGCIDPECIKLACPGETCFCTSCETRPCPLGPPDNDCHGAHTAPDVSGTIYCYDNAPCHFQDGYNYTHQNLPTYDGLCFSPPHATQFQCGFPAHGAEPVTPSWASSYTPVDGTFSAQTSPAIGANFTTQCSVGSVQGDHCHLDRSTCCHGPKRSHGDFSLDLLDTWKPSLAPIDEKNTARYDPVDFGAQLAQSSSGLSFDMPTTTSYDAGLDFTLTDSMFAFDNMSWTMPPPQLQTPNTSFDKLDLLVSAVPNAVQVKSEPSNLDDSGLFSIQPMRDQSSDSSTTCVCRWQHSPGQLCLATFDSPEALHKHVKASHVDSCARCQCQWEGCEACDKDFKQRSKLSRHLLGHAGYRPYACSFHGCNKTFATNQAKDNHERTHTGDRPYVCKECGYTTTTHTQLQTHISALHMNQKPHKCRYCDFKCADSSNLSKHERTHQTLRPYRCPHPGCTFKPDCRWENLKRHLRRSNHCPKLLVDGSEENKAYREGVRRETEEWSKRHEGMDGVVTGRRRGRSTT